MYIRYATKEDAEFLLKNDKHISPFVLQRKIENNEVILAVDTNVIVGWLRFNYFWDSTPFINMLYVLAPYRGQGIGRNLVYYFEQAMQTANYKSLMTSTLADEQAQHFYRKLGYRDVGCLLLPDEALEILFVKEL